MPGARYNFSGFSLVELLVAMFVSLLLLGSVGYFFSKFYLALYRSCELNRKDSSLIYVFEIINYDLMRAGYHYDGNGDPVQWDASNKRLIIRYVNYNISECEDKMWTDGYTSCNYEITYYLNNKKFYRKIDAGADGRGYISSMFPGNILIDNFHIMINKPVVQYKISCKFEGLRAYKNFDISNVIVCHNRSNY